MSDPTPLDLHSTQNSLPMALIRARERLMGPIRDMLSHIGLTEQQWRILRVLEEFGPMDVTQLADKACLLLPSLSRILRGMEEKRLIERSADEADRRRQIVEIADAGRGLLQDNVVQARVIAEQVKQQLGTEKTRQLLALLGEVERMKP
ncbi:homoprotocatechuate degradation operon regulator HpaR [Pseudoprimorskyibacter insulae]|uniref:HTH-type transcriptional regulator MhqR n=1 Tax=Pseudoprimorskyibacter insulae TaxID=1695997 RepID=A0A2R8B000_9RHOB|nr:homoprotocatechuate degradation operon regulator HpaR [Pseudoprimorskyibacter insulae]SPF81601.1 HTH-type transcriptional regulator MhqR [Pseudoprimorskyibacter insulae]